MTEQPGEAAVRDVVVIGDLMSAAAVFGQGQGGIVDLDGVVVSWDDAAVVARNVAQRLVAHGVRPGDRVVVAHPKSAVSYLAVHAVALAGAVMVPLDPLGPAASLATVVRAVDAQVVIGAAATLAQRLGDVLDSFSVVIATGNIETLGAGCAHDSDIVAWDEAAAPQKVSGEPPELPQVRPDDDAYIIFTSGSTGIPKGLMHTHASCLAYARAAVGFHRLDTTARVAGTSPLHFDMSTLELYAVPLAGATAVTIGEVEQRFPATLSEHLSREHVTHFYCVPYQLKQLMLRGDLDNHDWGAVQQIAFGGEAFDASAVEALGVAFPHAEIVNVYGPAEVNGVVTSSLGRAPARLDTVPIGHGWDGVTLKIVDGGGEVVEADGEGELWVDSPSTMRGYWRRPDLDDSLFVLDGRYRYYRTGDVVRRLADGTLVFVGRRDNRVKVRGVRLELEEVERIIAEIEGVAHAVAVVQRGTDGEHVMIWAVPDGGRPTLQQVRRHCAGRLPPSAVPQEILWTTELPVTATGKIDRHAVALLDRTLS